MCLYKTLLTQINLNYKRPFSYFLAIVRKHHRTVPIFQRSRVRLYARDAFTYSGNDRKKKLLIKTVIVREKVK